MGDEELADQARIVTRKQAKAESLKYYITGKPCKRGHFSKRVTLDGGCYECSLSRSLEWKDRNRTHVLEYASLYTVGHKDQINARERRRYAEWRSANPIIKQPATHERVCLSCKQVKNLLEFHSDRNSRLGVSNKCKTCATARAAAWYRANLIRSTRSKAFYYLNHKPIFAVRSRRWHLSHPGAAALYSRRRRARERLAGGNHTLQDIARIMLLQKNRCAICSCRLNRPHADHVIPLVLGGSNAANNIQILCSTCNLRKNRKHPLLYMRQIGRLL